MWLKFYMLEELLVKIDWGNLASNLNWIGCRRDYVQTKEAHSTDIGFSSIKWQGENGAVLVHGGGEGGWLFTARTMHGATQFTCHYFCVCQSQIKCLSGTKIIAK